MDPIDFDDLGFMVSCTRTIPDPETEEETTVSVVPIIHPMLYGDLIAEYEHHPDLDDIGAYIEFMQGRVENAREAAMSFDDVSSQIFLAPLISWDEYEWDESADEDAEDRFELQMEALEQWTQDCPAELLSRCDGHVVDSLRSWDLQQLIADHMISNHAGITDEQEYVDAVESLSDEILAKAYAFLDQEIRPMIRDHAHLTYNVTVQTADRSFPFIGTVGLSDDDFIDTNDGMMAIGAGEHALYAVAALLLRQGSVILRTMQLDEHGKSNEDVSGWIVIENRVIRLSSGEIFSAQCTAPDGEPIPPEPGVSYLGPDTNEEVQLI